MVRTIYLLKASYLTARTYKVDWYASVIYPIINILPVIIAIWYGSHIGLFDNFIEKIGTDNVFGYYAIGLVYWNYVEMLWPAVLTFRNYMRIGFFEDIFLTPITISEYLTGYTFLMVFIVTIQSLPLIIGIIPVLIFSSQIINVLIVMGIFVLSIFASYGFAYFLFGVTLRIKEGDEVVSILGNIAPLLGGLYFPITILPMPLKICSYIFPFTWAMDIIRGLLFQATTIFPIDIEIFMFILMSLFYFFLGVLAFRYLESSSRKMGLQGF